MTRLVASYPNVTSTLVALSLATGHQSKVRGDLSCSGGTRTGILIVIESVLSFGIDMFIIRIS